MVAAAELVLVIILLHSAIKDFLWSHPWWQSFLLAVPTIALPILAYFELRHSGEANVLRTESNVLRAEAIVLQGRITYLTTELETERNRQLQQIARKPVTDAEKNADTLRKHLEDQGGSE